MLWLLIVLITSLCRQSGVNGWTNQIASRSLPEGSACNATLEVGVCTRISRCQPYIDHKIGYTDLKRCSFIGIEEVVCCPVSFHVRQDQDTEPERRRQHHNSIASGNRFPESGQRTNRKGGISVVSHPEGSPCEVGICRRISRCQPYVEKKIVYTDLKRCSFIGIEEVVCCPVSFQVRQDQDTEPERRRQQHNSITPSNRFPESGHRTNRDEGSFCHLSSRTGVCTRISRCEALRIRAVKYDELTRCSFIGIEEVVCCPPTATSRIQSDWVRGNITVRQHSVPEKPRPSKLACDAYKLRTSLRRTFNILDGTAASPGEYPHVGAMLYSSEEAAAQYEVRCGASLISEWFALTAAHCVATYRPVLVRFGSVEWNPTANVIYRFDAKVKDIILHEDYVYYLTYHDIALVEFAEKISFNTLVYPACLHSTNRDLSPTIELKVAGWGSTTGSVQSKSFNLLSTNLRTVDFVSCKETFGLSLQHPRGLLDGQYCAIDPSGITNKDACFGDSGGPLMKDVEERIWELVGLVSFGKGCGPSHPGIYTRVSFYLDWIESKVWPKEKK